MNWEKAYFIMRIICMPIKWATKIIVWSVIVLIGLFILLGVIPELFFKYWSTGYSELHTIGKDLYISYNVDSNLWESISLANRSSMDWLKPVEADLIPSKNIEDGYIDTYSYDSSWVILKYIIPNKRDTTFYIFDKSFDRNNLTVEEIRENYIFQFTDSMRFAKACNENKIILKLE